MSKRKSKPKQRRTDKAKNIHVTPSIQREPTPHENLTSAIHKFHDTCKQWDSETFGNLEKSNSGALDAIQRDLLRNTLDVLAAIVEKQEAAGEKYPFAKKYKAAWDEGNNPECENILLTELHSKSAEDFRNIVFSSGIIKNPMSYRFTEDDYRNTMEILCNAKNTAEWIKLPPKKISVLEELLLYTHVFYHNSKVHDEQLNQCRFFQYSLSRQLRMICILIQSQVIKLAEHILEPTDSILTSLSAASATLPVYPTPELRISPQDSFENMLEYSGALFAYAYFRRSDDLKEDDADAHGEIHPFEKGEVEEISILEAQYVFLKKCEESIRYEGWTLTLPKAKRTKATYGIFTAPIDKNRYLCHRIAVFRRLSALHDQMETWLPMPDADKAVLEAMSKLNIEQPETFHMDAEIFRRIRPRFETVISDIRKNSCYQLFSFRGVTLNQFLDLYAYLRTFALLYTSKAWGRFDKHDKSSYHFLVPVMEKDYFVREYANLCGLNMEQASKALDCLLSVDTEGKTYSDIFSKPLICVSEKNLLLCPVMIEQMNLERVVACLAKERDKKYEEKLSKAGELLEERIRAKLQNVSGLDINPEAIVFIASDQKQVEFDCIGVLEEHLLLIECKWVLTPYNSAELLNRLKRIREGVEQVKRRMELACNAQDWAKIRKCVNGKISLPEKPFAKDKIIGVVCTNIGDFTSLRENGVFLTDESVLLDYFCNFSNKANSVNSERRDRESVEIKSLWPTGVPTATGFRAYLAKPDIVTTIKKCLQKQNMYIPPLERQIPLVAETYILSKDPNLCDLDMLNTKKDGKARKKKVGKAKQRKRRST